MEHPSSALEDKTASSNCADGGDTTPANTLCSGCDRTLCSQCLSLCLPNHAECHTSSSCVATTSVGKVKIHLKPTCKEHVDELVKFVCKDCKKSACTVCTSIYHRKCKSILPFESELASIISDLKLKKEDLLNKNVKLQRFIDTQMGQMAELEQNHRETEAGIVAACQDTTDIVTREEYLLLNDLHRQTGDYMDEIRTELMEEEMSIQMCKQQYVFMEQAIKSENEVEMYKIYMSLNSDEPKQIYKSGGKLAMKIPTISFIRNTTVCESLASLNLDSTGVIL